MAYVISSGTMTLSSAAEDYTVTNSGRLNIISGGTLSGGRVSSGGQKDDLLVRQYSTGMLGYYVCADQNQWVEMGRGVGMDWTVIA